MIASPRRKRRKSSRLRLVLLPIGVAMASAHRSSASEVDHAGGSRTIEMKSSCSRRPSAANADDSAHHPCHYIERMPDLWRVDTQGHNARVLCSRRRSEGACRVRPLWNPDARIQTRRTTVHLRMDPNYEREAMSTRNRFEMVATRANLRCQMCHEIARTTGLFAAMRAMVMWVAA